MGVMDTRAKLIINGANSGGSIVRPHNSHARLAPSMSRMLKNCEPSSSPNANSGTTLLTA